MGCIEEHILAPTKPERRPEPEDRFKDMKREDVAYSQKSDIEIAGMVRMLLRSDLDHEPVCVAARDRIMFLHWEARRLREALELMIGTCSPSKDDEHGQEAVRRAMAALAGK